MAAQDICKCTAASRLYNAGYARSCLVRSYQAEMIGQYLDDVVAEPLDLVRDHHAYMWEEFADERRTPLDQCQQPRRHVERTPRGRRGSSVAVGPRRLETAPRELYAIVFALGQLTTFDPDSSRERPRRLRLALAGLRSAAAERLLRLPKISGAGPPKTGMGCRARRRAL